MSCMEQRLNIGTLNEPRIYYTINGQKINILIIALIPKT